MGADSGMQIATYFDLNNLLVHEANVASKRIEDDFIELSSRKADDGIELYCRIVTGAIKKTFDMCMAGLKQRLMADYINPNMAAIRDMEVFYEHGVYSTDLFGGISCLPRDMLSFVYRGKGKDIDELLISELESSEIITQGVEKLKGEGTVLGGFTYQNNKYFPYGNGKWEQLKKTPFLKLSVIMDAFQEAGHEHGFNLTFPEMGDDFSHKYSEIPSKVLREQVLGNDYFKVYDSAKDIMRGITKPARDLIQERIIDTRLPEHEAIDNMTSVDVKNKLFNKGNVVAYDLDRLSMNTGLVIVGGDGWCDVEMKRAAEKLGLPTRMVIPTGSILHNAGFHEREDNVIVAPDIDSTVYTVHKTIDEFLSLEAAA